MKTNSIYDLRFTIYERLLALLGFMLLVIVPSSHAAGPPEFMAYQGFLVDANGNPLAPSAPANYPVIFKIFATPTGGSSLWSEQQVVTVDKGNFSVILGEGTAVGGEPRPALSTVVSTNGADRYIELSVTIGAAPPAPMLPRLRLLPMAYAFLATSANNLVSPNGVPVVRYANNRVEVTGDISLSGGISGNGAALSGLSASQIGSGTFADARLSANVALRAGGNTFTGNQSINGTLGIGTVGGVFPLTIGNNTVGDKISLWGQSGAHYGFGIAGGLLQIHSSDAGADIAFGYGSSAAMTETVRFKGNGNVGIGIPTPSARLSLTVPGSGELVGSAASTTLRTYSGLLGTSVNNELALASFGFNSGNQSSFGLRAIRATAGSDWTTAAIGLGMDVDNTPRAGGASLWLHGNGNVGIATTTPTARLDVNGSIRATSLTVTDTLNLGAAGQFKAAAGEESLRIVRGQVRLTPRVGTPTGAIPLAGTGFTVQRLTGYFPAGAQVALPAVFEITFATPFSGVPSVTVNAVRDFDSGGHHVLTGYQELWGPGRVELTTPNKAIVAFAIGGYYSVDLPFSFIAVGPR